MPKRPPKWVWKILSLTLLLLAIGALIDVITIIARRSASLFPQNTSVSEVINSPISKYSIQKRPAPSPTPPPPGPFNELMKNPDLNKPIFKESIYLDATPQQISATYEIYLSKDHPLLTEVQRYFSAEDLDTLVNEILDPIRATGAEIKFQTVDTFIRKDDNAARLLIVSQPIVPDREYYVVDIGDPDKKFNLQFQQREVVIRTNQARVWSYGKVPLSKTPETTVFQRDLNPNRFHIAIDFAEGAISRPEPETVPQRTLAELMTQKFRPPGLNAILYGVLVALPFILFLWWSRRYWLRDETAGFETKTKAVQLYLIFLSSIYFFLAVNELVSRWGNPAMAAFQWLQHHTIQIIDLGGREHESLLPRVLIFLCVWPLMVFRWERESVIRAPWKGRLWQLALIILFVGLLVWPIAALYGAGVASLSDPKVIVAYSVFIALPLFVLAALLLGLTFEMFRTRRSSAALSIFFFLVVLLALEALASLTAARYTDKLILANKIAGGVVISAAAVFLVSAFSCLTYRLITNESVSQAWKKWRPRKRVLVLLVIGIAAFSSRRLPPKDFDISTLAYILYDVFLLALIYVLVQFLRDKSSDALWLQLPEATRRAGMLLALVTFYSATTRWIYIPVTFLIGFLLLDRWLLPKKRFDKSLFAKIKGNRREIIKKVIRYNDEEKTLASLNKELLSQIAKGSTSRRECDQKYAAQSEVVETLRDELTIHGRFAKDFVLAFGPTDSAWQNGKKAALYGFGFSLPWTILALRDTIRGPAYIESYLIFDIVVWLSFFVMSWTAYGFVFGYFFPFIPGKNGIQKAISLFFTITLPYLVWAVLARPTDSNYWFSFGFWTLQIFVHTMLLGLVAGDYETLRAAGYRWKHLLEIHRLGALSAWASTVVIAIGTAVGTLITTGATQLVVSIFKFAADNMSPTGK